jgi:hypothetical protein
LNIEEPKTPASNLPPRSLFAVTARAKIAETARSKIPKKQEEFNMLKHL